MNHKNKISIPLEFILIISGMPGVGKSTLAINLIKKYSEFRSINQMNLLRFATRYFNNITGSSSTSRELYKGLRFVSHEEGKQHMLKISPVIKLFVERQLEKKIPTILEGVDFYPPYLFSLNKNKVLFINLYCSNEDIHYIRLTEREVQRHGVPSNVGFYFENIRKKNDLLHRDITELINDNMQSIDIANLNEKQVLKIVENTIKKFLKRTERLAK